MPKMPLNHYQVEHKKNMRFREAAAYAIDLSLRLNETITISEYSPSGKLLGHVYVEAKNDLSEG